MAHDRWSQINAAGNSCNVTGLANATKDKCEDMGHPDNDHWVTGDL